jgi:putative glutamine amidotransferase
MTDTPVLDDHVPRYGMNRTYFDAIRRAGGLPVPLAPGDAREMRLFFPAGGPGPADFAVDGLCLTGGGDLDPAHYGQPTRPGCQPPDPERDEMELALLELVRDRRVPVFAICRGIQVLNAARGGTLVQDLALERPQAGRHSFSGEFPRHHLAHEIRVAPGSRLHAILGAETCRVNSLHHQALDALAPGFTVTATAPDGVIEAIEGVDEGRFELGVQFHPEDLQEHAPMRRLFEAFVAAAGRYRAERGAGSPARAAGPSGTGRPPRA